MGKRSKDEMEEAVSEEPKDKSKKNKKDKKDRDIESSSATSAPEPSVETPVVEPETPKEAEDITIDDFERAKPIFKKWLADVKNK